MPLFTVFDKEHSVAKQHGQQNVYFVCVCTRTIIFFTETLLHDMWS